MIDNESAITIEWDFYQPPNIIWIAWIDPNIVKKWFGSDPNGIVLSVTMNVEIGKKFEVTFIGSDRIEHTCYGEYKKIKENEELNCTWNWKAEPNQTSEIYMLLLPTKYGTRMIFKHFNLNGKSSHNYEIGWTSTFKKLEGILI
jgi:uncharacterized protein YndB with AHSA1/START domain